MFCPDDGGRKRLQALLYGSYLLPYNSEIKLVHFEEVELESAVIDFPSQGQVDTSESGPKKTRAEEEEEEEEVLFRSFT